MTRPRRPPRGRPSLAGEAANPAEEASNAPRIIGGTLRGRRLDFVPDPRTRPMKDRVREALFNLLGPAVAGSIAVDCFAGTGALGFEALSRGAKGAWFGERHFPTADALRRSASGLGVADRATIRPGDVLLWARRLPEIPVDAPWTIFVSPPWSMFQSHTSELMALVKALASAAPAGSRMVVEADDTFDPVHLPGAGAWETRPMHPAVLFLRDVGPPRDASVPEGTA